MCDDGKVLVVEKADNLAIAEKSNTCVPSYTLSDADVRHNMIVCVMLDAIFLTGWADLVMATQPLLVYLNAKDSMIGAINGMMIWGLIGIFLSPFISRRFKYKKWYLLITHIPYLGALGLIGLALIYGYRLGYTKSDLLWIVYFLNLAHWFFAGFVGLPHQEYVAACIPMSHRGRFMGYSFSISGVTAIGSAAIGRWILNNVPEPTCYGYLFLMTWGLCQSGYALALLGRECPAAVEKAPRAWSKEMLKAAWLDKPFVRLMILITLYTTLIVPVWGFVQVYGLRELGMKPASSANIQIIAQIIRISTCALIGILTDRLGPKKILPYWSLVAFIGFASVICIRNPYGVYIAMGISTLYWAGSTAAGNALLYGIPSPENRAGHFTVQLIITYAASTIGPRIAGIACDHLSYPIVFTASAIIALLLYPFTKRMAVLFKDDAKSYS